MAATDELTATYRRQNLALRAQTIRDLQKLWPALDFRDLERTYPAWFAGASVLIVRDRTRAAGLASLFLRAHRTAAGVAGEPQVRLAGAPPEDRLETSLRVTTLVAVKRSMLAGKRPEQAMIDAFVQSSGAATRLVLDAGRSTITQTIASDPQTKGWERVTSGSACSFCQMLAGRGAVYSAETADFGAHDHCNCSVGPVYNDDRRKVQDYTPSQRFKAQGARDANNKAIRKYLASL